MAEIVASLRIERVALPAAIADPAIKRGVFGLLFTLVDGEALRAAQVEAAPDRGISDSWR